MVGERSPRVGTLSVVHHVPALSRSWLRATERPRPPVRTGALAPHAGPSGRGQRRRAERAALDVRDVCPAISRAGRGEVDRSRDDSPFDPGADQAGRNRSATTQVSTVVDWPPWSSAYMTRACHPVTVRRHSIYSLAEAETVPRVCAPNSVAGVERTSAAPGRLPGRPWCRSREAACASGGGKALSQSRTASVAHPSTGHEVECATVSN